MNSKSFAWLRALMFAALVPVLSLGLVACEPEGSDSEELENPGSEEFEDLGYIGGYAAVDLGLSVRWAAYNVGADSINVYGDYYAWGEIKPKKDYSQDTYLNTSFDVAQEVWGEGWRMPTKEECEELMKGCTSHATSTSGTTYYFVFTSKTNGNTISFGGYRPASPGIGSGDYGAYFLSSTLTYNSVNLIEVTADYHKATTWDRHWGYQIRPVYDGD